MMGLWAPDPLSSRLALIRTAVTSWVMVVSGSSKGISRMMLQDIGLIVTAPYHVPSTDISILAWRTTKEESMALVLLGFISGESVTI